MNILVLRYRFIGDTILTVPFLRNLRRAFPHARIDMMVAPYSSDVLVGTPYVDEFLVYDPPTIHADSSGRHGPSSPRPVSWRSFGSAATTRRTSSSGRFPAPASPSSPARGSGSDSTPRGAGSS